MADAKGPPYKSAADAPRGTPTPTQAELNKIAIGEAVELARDGTPEDTVNVSLAGNVIGVKPATPATHETPAQHASTRK